MRIEARREPTEYGSRTPAEQLALKRLGQQSDLRGKADLKMIRERLQLADAKAMSSLLVIGPAKGNRIIQILSAINYRFLGPNSR